MYGDSIYPWRPYLRSRNGAPAGQLLIDDHAMSSVRELIEHGFGAADQLWPWLSDPSSLRLMSGFPVQSIYFCKMYFTNLYLCLYHGLTTDRTGVQPPSLASYVGGVAEIARRV
jgi:hypothetical protein